MRVIVIGLRPKQHRHLASRVGGLVDLTFIEGDKDRPRLPQADHCLVVVGRVRHLWYWAAHERFVGGTFHCVDNNSLSAVADKIEELCGRKPCT